MKKSLLFALIFTHTLQSGSFDGMPTEIVQHIFDFSIQKAKDFSSLNLVSKQWYKALWDQKRTRILNQYLDYGIMHCYKHANIIYIDRHFQSLYDSGATLLKHPEIMSITEWIKKTYPKERINKIFFSLSPQHPLFQDLLNKKNIILSKHQITIDNVSLSYKQYSYKNSRIIFSSGLKDIPLEQRKNIVVPFLQQCHRMKGFIKLLLRFLTFQDIFPIINENNIHFFRHVIDPTGNPLLLSLVDHNQEALIKLYAKKGENLNITNITGQSALHRATTPEIVSLLLSLPIDPYIQSHNGYEAFHELCTISPFTETRVGILLLFLKAGFDINTKTKSGKTLLHLACLLNLYDIAQTTLDYNIDSNAQDKNGNTALHIACQNNKMSIILLLLERGARCNINNNENKTAFDYIKNYQRELLQLITLRT